MVDQQERHLFVVWVLGTVAGIPGAQLTSPWALPCWYMPVWLLTASTCVSSPEGFLWLPESTWTVPSWKCQGMSTPHRGLPSATDGSWSINATALSPLSRGGPEMHIPHASPSVPAASSPCHLHSYWLDTHSLLAPSLSTPYRMRCRGVTSSVNYLYWNPYLGLCFWGSPD